MVQRVTSSGIQKPDPSLCLATRPSTRLHFPAVHKTQVLLFNPNSQTRSNGLMTSSLKELFQRQSVLMFLHRSMTSRNQHGTWIRDERASTQILSQTMTTSTQTDRILPNLSPSQSQIAQLKALIGTNGTSSTLPTQKRHTRHHADQRHKAAIRHHHTHHYHQEVTHEDLHGTFRGTLMSAGNRSRNSTMTRIFRSC